ncbi:MAG: hypothetical protein A4E71_01681 [Smithella sp. PtaU1.Bin162]|nr:MAG: hypothetical protein A4E71_01681 [Smithella sp. PtaU1.Bin162]
MKRSHHKDDYDLQTLLELNGQTFYLLGGKYWVKFEAHEVEPTKHIPHGIKYSLTFHDKYNKRIIGYDNSHDCLPKIRKYSAKKEQWDHIHKLNKVYYYEFDCACELISDFWKTIERFLSKGRF